MTEQHGIPRLADIDEAFALQFDEALREYGGAIQVALADYEIEAVPPDLHVLWERLEMGVQYLRTLEREIDRWMGPYRWRWERERQYDADGRAHVEVEFPFDCGTEQIERFKQAWAEHGGAPIKWKRAAADA